MRPTFLAKSMDPGHTYVIGPRGTTKHHAEESWVKNYPFGIQHLCVKRRDDAAPGDREVAHVSFFARVVPDLQPNNRNLACITTVRVLIFKKLDFGCWVTIGWWV